MIRTLTLVLWVFAGTAYAQMSDDPAMQDINRRSALCRDFDCYYQVCADTFAQADEMLIQTLRNEPATLKAQEHNLSRNRPSEVRRNCTDHANIDVWCHGNDECIQDGEVARDRAK